MIDERTRRVSPPLSAEQWAERVAEWFPALHGPGARAVTWSLIAPHAEAIKSWLGHRVTIVTIA